MARDVTRTNLQLEPHQIILRPLVTEKSFHQAETERFNCYAFEVSRMAGKDDIRRAVEELFNVRVVRVNTATRTGKPRRTKFRWGRTKVWKKAIVKLHPEDRISFY
ncbi:MAG: 50S ribosomal protein L23 [Planctomycetes bacterium RBG_16_64_12]|nr:MAG: 50S ribosomal protein L23 [Planctomycetes bacterium RBG_16_64_12]